MSNAYFEKKIGIKDCIEKKVVSLQSEIFGTFKVKIIKS